MKKITFIVLHLGYGGVEKAITTVANSLSNDYEIEIISTYKLYDKPIFKLNDNIKVRYLISDLKPNRNEFLGNIKKCNIPGIFKEGYKALKILFLKKKFMIEAIKECNSDIMISTRDIHNKWLGKYANNDIYKIAWEHNHHNNNKKYINKIINSVKKIDSFVLVSSELMNFYHNKVKCNCYFIPNSISYNITKRNSLISKNIISVGRLSPEKGFSDLIDVFSLVNKKHPDWKLFLVGDGNERENIEKRINDLNLTNNIIMYGYLNKEELDKIYLKSSIYVMTSFTESFGIVLLEAFSYGVPCVSFDSANGANEIIKNNDNGYLISNRNKEKMANKICYLIENKDILSELGKKAFNDVKKYHTDNIKEKWVDLIEKR